MGNVANFDPHACHPVKQVSGILATLKSPEVERKIISFRLTRHRARTSSRQHQTDRKHTGGLEDKQEASHRHECLIVPAIDHFVADHIQVVDREGILGHHAVGLHLELEEVMLRLII